MVRKADENWLVWDPVLCNSINLSQIAYFPFAQKEIGCFHRLFQGNMGYIFYHLLWIVRRIYLSISCFLFFRRFPVPRNDDFPGDYPAGNPVLGGAGARNAGAENAKSTSKNNQKFQRWMDHQKFVGRRGFA
ncbi:MAG: hypothetical protein WB502_03615 [Thermoactinomyces sp.]